MDDFLALANFDGDGWRLYQATQGTDFQIDPWQWLAEAAPFEEAPEERKVVEWGRAWVAFNAWAGSVGRPTATPADLQKAGIGQFLLPVAAAVLTWPSWNEPGADFSTWSHEDLLHHLATHRTQGEAFEVLAARDRATAVGKAEITQPVEMALAKELERRGLKS